MNQSEFNRGAISPIQCLSDGYAMLKGLYGSFLVVLIVAGLIIIVAKPVRASGAVNVQATIDENGNVTSASAVSGHPLLRQSAEYAARNAKFAPTLLAGKAVKVSGVIVYNFTPE